jgi:hypothetical protein
MWFIEVITDESTQRAVSDGAVRVEREMVIEFLVVSS